MTSSAAPKASPAPDGAPARPRPATAAGPAWRRPTEADAARLRAGCAALALTYPAVGSTRTLGDATSSFAPPPGFDLDHLRTRLGHGEALFAAAAAAVASGQAFPTGWFQAFLPPAGLAPDEVVVVAARVGGLWWTNPARIVYFVDEQDARGRRRGFAYGTLPGHAERGEERFLVEQRPDGEVWFDLVAFSRPHHPLARACYPWARRMQARFARETAASLQRRLAGVAGAAPP